MKNVYKQSARLLSLGITAIRRETPLGIGLKKQCWGGVAAEIATKKGARVTDYYGISFSEFKDAINKNNRSKPSARNFVMGVESAALAMKVLRRNLSSQTL